MCCDASQYVTAAVRAIRLVAKVPPMRVIFCIMMLYSALYVIFCIIMLCVFYINIYL